MSLSSTFAGLLIGGVTALGLLLLILLMVRSASTRSGG
jgi:hypothetical protein